MGFLLRFQLLLVSFIIWSVSHGQNYTYSLQQFQFEDGLLHREVSTVYQDKQGFIWLGSPNGLQQFDGHEFKSWFDNDATGKKTSISKIGEDDKNWLWLWNTATNKFLFLNTITEQVLNTKQRFGADFPINNFQNQSGWTFLGDRIPTDSKNRLCFVTSNPNQLVYYHSTTGFQFYPLPNLSAKIIELKHLSKDNSVWVVEKNTKWNLLKLSAKGKKLQSFQFEEGIVLNDFTEKNGCLYFTAGDTKTEALYEINAKGELAKLTTKAFLSLKKRFYVSYIWDFTDNHWRAYDTLGKPYLFEVEATSKRKSLNPTDIKLFEDNKKRAWFYGQYGISVLSAKENSFVNYFTFNRSTEGPIKNSARGIAADSQSVFINFEYFGLLKFNHREPSKWEKVSAVLNESPYLGRALMYADKTFYSGHEATIQRFNAVSGQYLPQNKTRSYLPAAVWSIYKSDENIWVGREYDLAKWNQVKQVYEAIQLKNASGSLVVTGGVLQIKPIRKNVVWLCTNNGLLLVDLIKNEVIEHYSMLGKGKYNLPAQIFYSLHIDKNNIYWLGTNSGLIRWYKDEKSFRVFNKTDGLSNNTIYGVLEDDFGCLWLSSDYGIMRFVKATNEVSTFLTKDGIADNEFNRISYFKAKDGHIYFGGINGVTSFHPKDFIASGNESIQELLLTNFEVFDGKRGNLINKTGEIRQKKELVIYPTDKYVRIKFAVPNYEDDYLNTYAWKLGTQTKEWITQTDNKIQFDKLPYGDHILFIKGRNSGGKWSKTAQIKLRILRPFYLRNWFVFSLIGALILAIIYFWRRRTAKLKKQAAELQLKINNATFKIEQDKNLIQKQAEELLELDIAKTQFYTNVSHELRTPLTLVLGPLENVINNPAFKLPAEANNMLKLTMLNSKKLQARVNEILDLSKIDAGKLTLNLEPVKLNNLLQSIVQSFNVIAQKRGIAIQFDSPLNGNLVVNSDIVKLEKVISNLLSNAITHTPDNGLISVRLYKTHDFYNVQVQDNGEGIRKEEADKIFDRYYQTIGPNSLGGSGIGLALSKELALILGGDLNLVNSSSHIGATFLFKFKAQEVADAVVPGLKQAIEPIDDFREEHIMLNTDLKPTILVIEDNSDMRYFIKSILQNNYNVLEANDGREALNILKLNKVDLITCDIMMPNMDGLELITALKKMAGISKLPVIMLSARAQIEDKLAILKLGVDDYMVKPFYGSELLVRVKNLLSNKQAREEIQDEETNGEVESLWLEKVRTAIEQNISNALFSVADLCEEINIIERTLNRNLKKEIGLSTAAYIKELRLNRAMECLLKKECRSVKEASIAVGFLRPDYFTKEFYKRYGKKPSDYF